HCGLCEDRCPEADLILCADDAAAVTREEMHRVLRAVEDLSAVNKLKVNVAKTKVMKFRKGGRLAKSDVFEYAGQTLEIINEFVYLGVTLQTKLSFSSHVARVKRKSMTATAMLTKYLSRLSLSSVLKMFK